MSQTAVTPWKNGYYRYKSTSLWVVKVYNRLGKEGSELFLAISKGLLGDFYGLLRYPKTRRTFYPRVPFKSSDPLFSPNYFIVNTEHELTIH